MAFPEEGKVEIPEPLPLLRWSRPLCLQLFGKRPSPIVSMRLLLARISTEKTSSTSMLLPVRLRWSAHTHDWQAFLDPGAEGNFMDNALPHKLQIPLKPLTHRITAMPSKAKNFLPFHSPLEKLTSSCQTTTLRSCPFIY